MDSARQTPTAFLAVLSLLVASLSAYSAPIPEWLARDAIEASELRKGDIDIDCYRIQGPICITLSQWCRIQQSLGVPVEQERECAVRQLYGKLSGE